VTRRTRLACAVVRLVLPIWESSYRTKYPRLMVVLAEGYLDGEVPRSVLMKRADSFAGVMQNPGVGVEPLVGHAAVSAAMIAYLDETLQPGDGVSEEELYDPSDPDAYDCAYVAAGAYAGGMSWMDGFDADRNREFWSWYLDEAIPAAYAQG
jgi:hypothetical protein